MNNDREQVPRKQGLKLIYTTYMYSYTYRSRASSTKTRIETEEWRANPGNGCTIESKFHENKDWNLSRKDLVENKRVRSRASSTKTRIETLFMLVNPIYDCWDREQVPRKQGLKRSPSRALLIKPSDREQVPRKQGLKQMYGTIRSWKYN